MTQRYRFTNRSMTPISSGRAPVRDAAPPRRAATHTHIYIHDRRDQLREDPDSVAGLKSANAMLADPRHDPDPRNYPNQDEEEGRSCLIRPGERFVTGIAKDGSGFALRRDTSASDQRSRTSRGGGD
jgi:hypothetical protein